MKLEGMDITISVWRKYELNTPGRNERILDEVYETLNKDPRYKGFVPLIQEGGVDFDFTGEDDGDGLEQLEITFTFNP